VKLTDAFTGISHKILVEQFRSGYRSHFGFTRAVWLLWAFCSVIGIHLRDFYSLDKVPNPGDRRFIPNSVDNGGIATFANNKGGFF
jgi:hypothetical protein